MTTSFGTNELIFNYHDAVLYGSDISLLDCPTAWLNDACINFQMTRLQHRERGAAAGKIIFFDPSVISFLMHQCTDEDDVQDFRRGYNNFEGIKKLFLPINDGHAASYQRPGSGTHWSLLMVLKGDEQISYYHFDSIQGNNLRAARVVATKLETVLSAQDSKNRRTSSTKVEVRECRTPQQANGYDCGIHMLAAAEVLSNVDSQDGYVTALHEWVRSKNRTTGAFAVNYRENMVSDVRQLVSQYRENKPNM